MWEVKNWCGQVIPERSRELRSEVCLWFWQENYPKPNKGPYGLRNWVGVGPLWEGSQASRVSSVTQAMPWSALGAREFFLSVHVHCIQTYLLFFFLLFGGPIAYAVPRPGIRSELQLQPAPPLQGDARALTHCARLGIEPASHRAFGLEKPYGPRVGGPGLVLPPAWHLGLTT